MIKLGQTNLNHSLAHLQDDLDVSLGDTVAILKCKCSQRVEDGRVSNRPRDLVEVIAHELLHDAFPDLTPSTCDTLGFRYIVAIRSRLQKVQVWVLVVHCFILLDAIKVLQEVSDGSLSPQSSFFTFLLFMLHDGLRQQALLKLESDVKMMFWQLVADEVDREVRPEHRLLVPHLAAVHTVHISHRKQEALDARNTASILALWALDELALVRTDTTHRHLVFFVGKIVVLRSVRELFPFT